MFLSLSTTDWSSYGTDIFATYLCKAIWHMCMLQSKWGNALSARRTGISVRYALFKLWNEWLNRATYHPSINGSSL